jgi:prevent-host-death family protein
MAKVGAFEAKTRLSSLLDRVASGEEITITRHGEPVAVLVPAKKTAIAASVSRRISEIRKIRKGIRLRGDSIKELIAEGRKH